MWNSPPYDIFHAKSGNSDDDFQTWKLSEIQFATKKLHQSYNYMNLYIITHLDVLSVFWAFSDFTDFPTRKRVKRRDSYVQKCASNQE